MQKRIVYSRPDGGVSIVVPAPGVDLDVLKSKVVPLKWCDVSGVIVCQMPGDPDPGGDVLHIPIVVERDSSDIPTDRTFRDAWKADLTVDMPKARNLHMARIRYARDAELAKLDIEQLKGVDVAAEKQRLRDIPQTFDLTGAKTPDDLSALWPSGLVPADVSKPANAAPEKE